MGFLLIVFVIGGGLFLIIKGFIDMWDDFK